MESHNIPGISKTLLATIRARVKGLNRVNHLREQFVKNKYFVDDKAFRQLFYDRIDELVEYAEDFQTERDYQALREDIELEANHIHLEPLPTIEEVRKEKREIKICNIRKSIIVSLQFSPNVRSKNNLALEVDKELYRELWDITKNMSEMSRILGVTPKTIRKRLNKYNEKDSV